MKRRIPTTLLMIMMTLILVVSCIFLKLWFFPIVPVAQVQPLDRVTLQLKWKHQFQFAGYYAAQAQGYYREAGLEVKILEAPDNMEPAEVVLRGNADFGITTSDLVLLRSEKQPVVAMAAIYQHSPLVFLANAAAGINHIHDLAGKRIMIEPHSAELIAYLKQENISTADIIPLPHTFDPLSLIEGKVDAMSAYSTDEPFILQQANIDYLVFTPRAGGIDFYGDTLFTTEEQIKKHPERVKAFLEASLRGWQYALSHSDEIVDLIYSRYSRRHSLDHLKFEAKMTRNLIMPEVVEIGYMNLGRWRYIAETYKDLGLLPGKFTLEGFIYERNPQPDLTWFYLLLGGIFPILAIVAWLAWHFYRLNVRIRREVAERILTENSLRQLENRYRILVENAPLTIIISTIDDGTICYINPEASQKLEVSQQAILGQRCKQFYVNHEHREAIVTILSEQGFIRNFETQLLTANGQIFWANISATLIEFEKKICAFGAIIDISDRKKLEGKLEKMAMTDYLTGLYNRRYFYQIGLQKIYFSKRHNIPLSLLLIDVDKFKVINDDFGHDSGDIVLKFLTQVLQNNSRTEDILARLGGEEFALLLPYAGLDEAVIFAERIREQIKEEVIRLESREISITISIGVATLIPEMGNMDNFLKAADIALYQAKESGRDRVVKYL